VSDFNKIKQTLFITTILGYIQDRRSDILSELLSQHNTKLDYSPEVNPDLLILAQIEYRFLQLMTSQVGPIPDVNLNNPKEFFDSIVWFT
jgi:hypothetical protein